jgi:iron(III) transport system permease protein
MPGFLSSIAYVILMAPNSGIVNQGLRIILEPLGYAADRGPLNIYSIWGMIFVEGIRGATTVFLIIVAAFRLMDPALEDAAIMSGSGRFETLRRITIPLLTPALLGGIMYAFVGNLQDMDTPLVLGLPAGIFVLPTLIYFIAYRGAITNWGVASVYATLFVLLMAALSFIYFRYALRGSHRYATVLGKGYRPQRIKLGGWRFVALFFVFLYALFSVILPFLTLLWTSLTPGAFQPPTMKAFGNLNWGIYSDLLTNSRFLQAAWNTAGTSIIAATATMLLAIVSAWAVVRLRVRGAMFLDTMAFIPLALPSVALGVGMVLFYLGPVGRLLPVYGTWALLVIAFVVNYVAFATRVSNGGIAQLGAELEEASWVTGHGKISTLFRITSPLLKATFLAGFLWIVSVAAKNLTLPLLLASPSTETLSMRLWFLWDHFAEYDESAAIGVVMMVVIGGLALAARRLLTRAAGT